MRSPIAYLILTMTLILSFQNCDRASVFSSKDDSTQLDAGNGHPYDGIYVMLGPICADGSAVHARIVVNSSEDAQLVRQNCLTIAPMALGASELSAGPARTVVYQNQIFTAEVPAIKVAPLTSWYYQLTGTLQAPAATLYDIDLFETSAATIQSLKAANHIVICEFSAGTDESYRPDAASFAAGDKGNSAGSQEVWVDTRSANVRAIMTARLDLAKSKGCDGVDPDSVNAYENSSGFPLTATTQTDYNEFLAFAAHDRKLIVALKNADGLATTLVNAFDFAIAQQCLQYNECGSYQPFVSQGKAVLVAEQTAKSAAQCTEAANEFLSLIYVNTALDGSVYQTCP